MVDFAGAGGQGDGKAAITNNDCCVACQLFPLLLVINLNLSGDIVS